MGVKLAIIAGRKKYRISLNKVNKSIILDYEYTIMNLAISIALIMV